MANKLSPEERLFRLIKKGKGPSGKHTFFAGKQKTFLRPVKGFFSHLGYNAESGKKVLLAAPYVFKARLHQLDLGNINKILFVGLAATTAFTVYYAASQKPGLSGIPSSVSGQTFAGRQKEEEPQLLPLSEYTKKVKKRDIFNPFSSGEKQRPSVRVGASKAKEKLKGAIEGFRLKGISWGEDPKVMIKQEKKGDIYFVKPGQAIGVTGIKVKKILKNKVILIYGGEEAELM